MTEDGQPGAAGPFSSVSHTRLVTLAFYQNFPKRKMFCFQVLFSPLWWAKPKCIVFPVSYGLNSLYSWTHGPRNPKTQAESFKRMEAWCNFSVWEVAHPMRSLSHTLRRVGHKIWGRPSCSLSVPSHRMPPLPVLASPGGQANGCPQSWTVNLCTGEPICTSFHGWFLPDAIVTQNWQIHLLREN